MTSRNIFKTLASICFVKEKEVTCFCGDKKNKQLFYRVRIQQFKIDFTAAKIFYFQTRLNL